MSLSRFKKNKTKKNNNETNKHFTSFDLWLSEEKHPALVSKDSGQGNAKKSVVQYKQFNCVMNNQEPLLVRTFLQEPRNTYKTVSRNKITGVLIEIIKKKHFYTEYLYRNSFLNWIVNQRKTHRRHRFSHRLHMFFFLRCSIG